MNNPRIVVSTTPSLEGWSINQYLGVVSAHIVAGTGFLFDILGSFSDFFGGRSHAYQGQLDSIQVEALDVLRTKAQQVGGNAIVGVRLDHDEISGKGKQMFMVTATGTAVRATPQEERTTVADLPEDTLASGTLRSRMEYASLLRRLENKSASVDDLDKSEWQLICDNADREFAPIALRAVMREELLPAVEEYLRSLGADAMTEILYDELVSNTHTARRNVLLKIVRRAQLLDVQRIKDILQRGSPEAKRTILLVAAKTYKAAYLPDDITALQQLSDVLKSSFANTGKECEVVRGLSRTARQMWECECGKKNELTSI